MYIVILYEKGSLLLFHTHSLAIFGQQVTPQLLEDIPGWFLLQVLLLATTYTSSPAALISFLLC